MARMTYRQYETALDAIVADGTACYDRQGVITQPQRDKLNARVVALKESAEAAGVIHPIERVPITRGNTTMPKLTLEQRRARAKAIVAESERSGRPILETIRTVNARMRAEAARPARNSVAETAPARRPTSPGAKKAARIAQAVRESLAATAAARAAATAPVPLHEATNDQLDAAVMGVGRRAASPFWDGRKLSPAAPATETTDAETPDLSKLSLDELDVFARDAFTRYGQAAGLRSPLWAVA